MATHPEIRDKVDLDISQERGRQTKLWGIQNHPNGTGSPEWKDNAMKATLICNFANENGLTTWLDILYEEVAEAFAETDETKLRTELIQVAAVCKAWVECLDSQREDAE